MTCVWALSLDTLHIHDISHHSHVTHDTSIPCITSHIRRLWPLLHIHRIPHHTSLRSTQLSDHTSCVTHVYYCYYYHTSHHTPTPRIASRIQRSWIQRSPATYPSHHTSRLTHHCAAHNYHITHHAWRAYNTIIIITHHITHIYRASHHAYSAHGPYHIYITSHITQYFSIQNYHITHRVSRIYITHHMTQAYRACIQRSWPLPHIHHMTHHTSLCITQMSHHTSRVTHAYHFHYYHTSLRRAHLSQHTSRLPCPYHCCYYHTSHHTPTPRITSRIQHSWIQRSPTT